MQGWRMHCMLTKTRDVAFQATSKTSCFCFRQLCMCL